MRSEMMNTTERFVEEKKMVQEELLVAKILQSKELAMNTFFQCALEIGKCLTEAKAIIKHGQWTSWLKERVQFSERTAQNYMRIYKETEQNGSPLLKTQAFADLGYAQVIEILSLPGEMQEEFLSMHDAKEMSSREVKKAVAEMKAQNEDLTAKLKSMEKEKSTVQEDRKAKEKEIESLVAHVEALQSEQELAVKNRDKELEKAVANAIKDTEKKIASAEKEHKLLLDKFDKLSETHRIEIEQLKARSAKEKETLLEKKEKELEKKTKSFNEKLDKVQRKLEASEKAKTDAESKAAMNEAVVKCKVLMERVQSDCKEALQILSKLEGVDKPMVQQLRTVMNETLTAIVERNKLTEVTKAS